MEVDFDNGYKVRMSNLRILSQTLSLSRADIALFPSAFRASRVNYIG